MKYEDEQLLIAVDRNRVRDDDNANSYTEMKQQAIDRMDQWQNECEGGDLSSEEIVDLVNATDGLIRFIERERLDRGSHGSHRPRCNNS